MDDSAKELLSDVKQKLQEIYLLSCFPNSLNTVKMTKSPA